MCCKVKHNIYVVCYNLLVAQKEWLTGLFSEDNAMQFYQRLRDIREDADKTQSEIAALLGTRQQQYARWESGAFQMPIEHYKTLARYYNVSLDYLAGLIDTPRKLK